MTQMAVMVAVKMSRFLQMEVEEPNSTAWLKLCAFEKAYYGKFQIYTKEN